MPMLSTIYFRKSGPIRNTRICGTMRFAPCMIAWIHQGRLHDMATFG